jgi:putative membrane protein
MNMLTRFLIFWGVNVLCLWIADELFKSIAFRGLQPLLISGLLLGIANTLIRPVLVLLTLPVTVLTLGLFLLVINGLMLMLVAWLVPGFTLAGFWPAVGIALFVSVISSVIYAVIGR